MYTVLVGNGINNVTKDNSWDALVTNLVAYLRLDLKIDVEKKKHFPLLYEEIFLSATKIKKFVGEEKIKEFIAEHVLKIGSNDLHDQIRALPIEHVITTNYEFTLEGTLPKTNKGIVKEKLYSVFRHYEVNKKKFWHVHGDCHHPLSINLGFEHYSGQLQLIRSYVATGTNYKTKYVHKRPLIARLQTGDVNLNSWLDLFFVADVHILGLTLGFVETDLWWLLTYRARTMAKYPKLVKNKLFYYIPKMFEKDAKTKLDLMKATGIEVVVIDKTGQLFYQEIINGLKRLKH